MNTQDFSRGLTPEQHTAYRNEGFITVRGVFPDDEVERMRAECEALLSRPELFENDIPEAAARRDLNGDPVRDRLDPIVAVSPLFARTAADPRLVGLASSIFGSPAQLFKDKPPIPGAVLAARVHRVRRRAGHCRGSDAGARCYLRRLNPATARWISRSAVRRLRSSR